MVDINKFSCGSPDPRHLPGPYPSCSTNHGLQHGLHWQAQTTDISIGTGSYTDTGINMSCCDNTGPVASCAPVPVTGATSLSPPRAAPWVHFWKHLSLRTFFHCCGDTVCSAGVPSAAVSPLEASVGLPDPSEWPIEQCVMAVTISFSLFPSQPYLWSALENFPVFIFAIVGWHIQ